MRYADAPLFTRIEGRSPILFHIATKNFLCPLHPFDWNHLQIGSATLDLGQVTVQSGPALQSLLKLLKNPRTKDTLPLWFTPVTFQMENGLIQAGRIDFLFAQSIHLCSWGNIHWAQNQLDLFLGIPADTLSHAFGLKHLPRNYVLKVPIRGTLQNPEIDTGAASSKIAAMITAQELPKIGGTGGKAFGSFLKLLQSTKEDQEVPPPNRPFPWE